LDRKYINARNATDPGPLREEPACLSRVRVVLVATLHARNIGSVARAMKVMGLQRLVLVKPQQFPHKDARDLAVGAEDLLEQAVVVDTLSEAIADCVAVYGASARRREIPLPEFTPRAFAEHAVLTANADAEVALLLGPEAAGLDNAALAQCQYLVQIPANPAFASLNLAAALQILSYELRLAALQERVYQPRHIPAANAEFEQFFTHFLATATEARFFANKNVEISSTQLRRVMQRMAASSAEVKMLRGLLSQLQLRMRGA
jgi:tRNA (cytidine32/uridine32-2'-O)-methyltransferase